MYGTLMMKLFYCSLGDLHLVLRNVEANSPDWGLKLNGSKSLLFIPKDIDSDCNHLPSAIPISRTSFFMLVAPIGPPEFSNASTMKRLDKISTAVSRLHDVKDSQLEITFLCSCLVMPKFNFSLRSCPPSHIKSSTRLLIN